MYGYESVSLSDNVYVPISRSDPRLSLTLSRRLDVLVVALGLILGTWVVTRVGY